MLMEDIQIEVYRSTLKIPAIFFVPAIFVLSLYVLLYLFLNSNFFIVEFEKQLNHQLPGQFSIGKLQIDSSLTSYRLLDVKIRSEKGEHIIDSGTITLGINPFLLLAKQLVVNFVNIEDARVHIALEDDGINFLSAIGLGGEEKKYETKPIFKPYIKLKNMQVHDSYFSFAMENMTFSIDDINLPRGELILSGNDLEISVPALAVKKIPFHFQHEMFHLKEHWGDWSPIAEEVSLKNWKWRGDGFTVDNLAFSLDGTHLSSKGLMRFPDGVPDDASFVYEARAHLSAPYWSRAAQYFLKDLVHFDAEKVELHVKGNLAKVDLLADVELNQLDAYGLQFYDLKGKFELDNQFIMLGPTTGRVAGGSAKASSAYFDMFTGVFGARVSGENIDPAQAVAAFGFDFPWLTGKASGAFSATGHIPYEEEILGGVPLLGGFADAVRPVVSVTMVEDLKFQRKVKERLPGYDFRVLKGSKIWSQVDRFGVPNATVISELGRYKFKDFVLHFDRWSMERTLQNRKAHATIETEKLGKLVNFYGGSGIDGELKLDIDAEGKMNFPDADISMEIHNAKISVANINIDGESIHLDGNLSKGRMTLTPFVFDGKTGEAKIQGYIDVLRNPKGVFDKRGLETSDYLYPLYNSMKLDIILNAFDLNRLGSSFGFVDVKGKVFAKGSVSGTLQKPKGKIEIEGREVEILGQKVNTLNTDFIFKDSGEYKLEDAKIDLGKAGRITGDFSATDDGQIIYAIKGKKLRFEHINFLENLGLSLKGNGDFHLHGKGDFQNPKPGGYIRIDDVSLAGRKIGDLALVVDTIQNTTFLSGALLPWITIDAEIPMDKKSSYYAKFGIDNIDLSDAIQEIREIGIIKDSKATGIVELYLERDFSRYQVLVNLSDLQVDAFGKHFQNKGPIIAGLNEGRLLQIQQGKIGSGEKYTDIHGGVFLDQSLIDLEILGEMDLSLLNGIRLAFPAYMPDSFLEAEGSANIDLRIKGPPDAIEASGEVDFNESAFLLRGFSDPLKISSGKMVISGDEIKVARNSPILGRILGGLFSLTGSVGLISMSPKNLKARIRTQNISYRVPEVADITLGTNLELNIKDFDNPETWKVKGDIDILDGLYYEDFSVLEDALTSRLLGKFTQRASRYDGSIFDKFPILNEMLWDINIRARDGVKIRNEIDRLGLDIELRLGLRLRNTLLNPDLSGEIDLIGGSVAFQGEKFKIRSGTLNFSGDARNPFVDVIAEADIQNVCHGPETSNQGRTMSLSGVADNGEQQIYRVILNIIGKLDNMNIQFESNPFADQRDILSLLLTGCTVDQLTASSAGSPTLEVALGPVLGWIEGQVQDVVKVEEFTITPSFDRLKATVGDSITRRLSWRFQLDTGLTDTAGGQIGKFVYKLSDEWSAQLSESTSDNARSDESNFLIEVKLKYRLLVD